METFPGFDKCPACNGQGEFVVYQGCDPWPCRICSGVGSVPGDTAVEAVWRIIETSPVGNTTDPVRAALVAYAQHAKEK